MKDCLKRVLFTKGVSIWKIHVFEFLSRAASLEGLIFKNSYYVSINNKNTHTILKHPSISELNLEITSFIMVSSGLPEAIASESNSYGNCFLDHLRLRIEIPFLPLSPYNISYWFLLKMMSSILISRLLEDFVWFIFIRLLYISDNENM